MIKPKHTYAKILACTATMLGLLMTVWGASPAFAEEPWWRLASMTQPTNIRPGLAKDEVQELSVNATGGMLFLFDEENEEGEFAPWNASAEQLTEALEVLYGAHSVEVTGGPSQGTLKPYVMKFVGARADQHLTPVSVQGSSSYGGLRGTATVSELDVGRPDGRIVLLASDLGDTSANGENTPIIISDKLPQGLKAVGISGAAGEKGLFNAPLGYVKCELARLSCEFAHYLPVYDSIEVTIPVVAEADVKTGEMTEASVTGGGGTNVTIKRPITVSDASTPFGVSWYEISPEEEGGALDTQAGSHPFQLTTSIFLNQELNGKVAPKPVVMAKDLNFKLPPGLIGNPTPFVQCRLSQFSHEECPQSSAIGVAKVFIKIFLFGEEVVLPVTASLYNLEPATGEPARFGFAAANTEVILDTAVRTGADYGVTVTVRNITELAEFLGSEVTFWGVPGDARHNKARGGTCLIAAENPNSSVTCPSFVENKPPPLLSLPTSCTGPLQSSVEADSWEKEGEFSARANSEEMPALDGCNRLQFEPSITSTPDGQAGSTPTGLAVTVHVPQQVSLDGEGLSEADVRNTTVALPEGVALNPAAADGLQACSVAQIGLEEAGPSSCPESSKVGLVKIKTPLLPNPLEGDAYLAAQDANPFGSLVALYVLAEDPVSGTRVKLAGEVVPNPVTGQLVTTFKNTPQLPFETFELHFFGGDRAPLATPSRCGAYTTTASVEPWTGGAPTDSSSTFDVISGPNGSGCANPLPFAPLLTAGTTSIQAGGFSPFTMTMSRTDGNQNLQAIKLHMPPGLLGTLATVKLCGEPQADQGTCGPESLIGHTTVSVGVGGDPYSVTGGRVYITGPYQGAPYGLSIVNPAKAGPYDLGQGPCDCIVVRAKIEVDPLTAQLTITSDNSGPYKIPTMLDGIPLQIQHVNVSIDRPNFTFNPTNCSPLAVTGNLSSSQGANANVSVPFQITNCAVLAFKPKLTARTSGKTSRKNGASLAVKLTYPAGPYDANIAKVKVDLPKQLPSRLTTLQKACTAATFEANPANCPPASIVGHATATTPVMPVPLTGPAYFVSHAGEEFPSLIIVLQGYGATVHLVGATYIDPKTSITSSTFKSIPDVPVGTFELTLPQGKYSALAANANLCTAKLGMPTSFIGQNGAQIHTTTPIVATGCSKHAVKKSKKKKQAKAKKK